MKSRNFLSLYSLAAGIFLTSVFVPERMLAQSTATIVTLTAADLAYSDVTQLVYASNTNSSTLTPINPVTGAVGTPISIPGLLGRICASDGGSYIFAALNGSVTNHICQFDVNAQAVVNSWSLGAKYADDMTAVPGSPAAVAVDLKITNSSPRFSGVVVYDNGVARSNSIGGFEGPNVLEVSSRTNRLYGYDNETSPDSTKIYQVDATGLKQIGSWSTLQGFSLDISWRAGWLFATSGQIFDPDRGIQVSTFQNTPVIDDAASGRFYEVSPGAIIAYDQNTLIPCEGAALTGMTGAAGSLVRCGTNGFALRMNSTKVALIHTSFQSSGPPADVSLTVAPPTLPVPTGSLMSYTLTISNQGPNTAQNVTLTQTLPTNATFVSVTSSSGSNAPQNGGLLSLPYIIPAGGTVTVTVTLQTLKPGLLASIASVTSDSLDPNLSNNVVRLEFPVGAPLAKNSVTEMFLPTTDLAWDRFSGRIFASIPNTNWLLGNSIAALDPTTGNFEPRILTGMDPGKLAVSDNGQYLYAGINGETAIQRVTVSNRSLDIKFASKPNIVGDMVVLPGTPGAIAVTSLTTLAVYDDGVMRSNTVGPGAYNFPYTLAATESNTLVYEGMPDGLHGITIGPTGATNSVTLNLIATFDDQIKYASKLLYTGSGRVIDPVAQAVVTNLPYSGVVCADAAGGKLFYLTMTGTTGTLHSINLTNYTQFGTITVTNVQGSPTELIRWGGDGLAFRTTSSQVFLVRSSLVDDANNDGIADAWELANFGTLSVDPNGDPDHDGLSNLTEYLIGTDPNDKNSAPHLTNVRRQGGNIALNWQAGTNVTYYIQRSAALGAAAAWQDVFTNLPSGSSTNGFTDLGASSGVNYYRLRVPLP